MDWQRLPHHHKLLNTKMCSSQCPPYLLMFYLNSRRTDRPPKKQRESSIGQKMGSQPHGVEDFVKREQILQIQDINTFPFVGNK